MPTCSAGHGLASIPPNDYGWICDAALGPAGPAGCRRGMSEGGPGSAGVSYYRCDACDYDLCDL